MRFLQSSIKGTRCDAYWPSFVSYCIIKVESRFKITNLKPKFQANIKPYLTASNLATLFDVMPKIQREAFNPLASTGTDNPHLQPFHPCLKLLKVLYSIGGFHLIVFLLLTYVVG